MSDFSPDVELDAMMVYAGMRGFFVPFAMQRKMTPNEAYGRACWLKRQSEKYIGEVINKVIEIENKSKLKKSSNKRARK